MIILEIAAEVSKRTRTLSNSDGNTAIKQSDYNWEKNDKNSEVILAWQKMIIYFLGHFLLLMA